MPFFESNIARFHYHKYGNGEQIMLAFHGFGMRGTQFQVLDDVFKDKYTIYSFDLFFHGETILFDTSRKAVKKSIDTQLFAQEMLKFIDEVNIGQQKITLLAYSIGAKLAFSLIHEIPHIISCAYFIAPDGIEPNQLLTMGGGNKIVNAIFWQLVFKPKTVMFCLNSLLRLKYIDNALHYILEKEFATEETRMACYNTITYFSGLSLNKAMLQNKINEHGIETHFYFGSKDALFPPKIGERFCKDLKRSRLSIINDGHDLVNQNLNELIKSQLTEKELG